LTLRSPSGPCWGLGPGDRALPGCALGCAGPSPRARWSRKRERSIMPRTITVSSSNMLTNEITRPKATCPPDAVLGPAVKTPITNSTMASSAPHKKNPRGCFRRKLPPSLTDALPNQSARTEAASGDQASPLIMHSAVSYCAQRRCNITFAHRREADHL
jgi:hypothetical protein